MRVLQELIKNKYLYSLAIPGFIFLAVFSYAPLSSHLLAFKSFQLQKGVFGSDWVGFDNFRFFFDNPDWLKITWNTVYLNALFLFFQIAIATLFALFLNEIRAAVFKRLVQSFVFLPYFISWLVVSLMVFGLFNGTNGIANRLFAWFGWEAVDWYQTPWVWPIILTMVSVWKNAGYLSIILLASIVGISGDYYESARIDGATRFQQVTKITLPLLRPVIIVLTLLGIGKIFYGDFGMIYGIIGDNGVLYPTTDVIDTYSYRALRQLGDFSMSSAIVLYQSVMGLLTIVIFNAIVRKIDKDSRLF
ncbi:ABC transporter permease subunit [Paenibacillus sacheonensis]|uniref:ABC transporter permease subunit n=1 Tax=Paenibacillus sacheonensis TaxID=742054 RepID=A0A7X4YMR7_9BACL|nr:putative aldouronate transport system permease protein [Paenibacillus sacheonensis]NBC68421.1 ABC transporter permease subunit [Paenibacillus sacheonensis]